jgi:RHS repeat-associated protein
MKSQNAPISLTQLSLPGGGGTIQGMGETFQATEFTGTASFSLPLPTSPSRNFEPDLSIDYSSGAGNGPYGLGFALSIPAISRKTSKGLPRYNDLDTFLLSQAEDLVPDLNGPRAETRNTTLYQVVTYRPRIEGAFAKIEQWTETQGNASSWRVVSSNNVTSLFGTTEQTRIVDPAQPTHIFSWLLAETFDARGNSILYEYISENNDNVPATLSESNRTQTANKYIHRIAYGNAAPFQEGQTTPESWHFEVIFDYGEYDTDPANTTPFLPVGTWENRSDSFSTYQAGFEMRTHRLCRQVLLFHTFEELGADPVLVHVTRLQYQTSPIVSLLQTVESIGYRSENGHYATRSLPPLELCYTAFQPSEHQFVPLQDEVGQFLPGLDRVPDYQLVDLYGEGIPGILYSDGQTVSYREPNILCNTPEAGQSVCYAPPQHPHAFPIEGNRHPISMQLVDLTGDGLLDLVVSTSIGSEGYYKATPDHTWEAFRPLPSLPTDFSHPDTFRVDVTGDGLIDILLLENERTRVYPSRGADGFGPELIGISQQNVPLSRQGAQNEYFGFADLFGSGMVHLVRITNGRVECWPNLGYGRFGEPVLFENAPHFGADLDASRLFLADLDGSGTADLIYAYPDHVEIFFNQSGNAFSDPLSLPLPSLWDRVNQIQFADIYGNGATCLVFSDNHTQPRHWCYDFTQGQKPYLLSATDNHLGAQSTITYRSSVSYYLEDKQKGTPWIVNLPFPVQVVAQTESIDQISQTRLVSTYAYHHGYYDGIEREFRGFGMVERQDAEILLADSQPTDVPPVLTKTWYHTGAWRQDQSLSRQYVSEYYQQDTQAYQLPDSVYAVSTNDMESWREAFRSLKGLLLREEVYAPTAPVLLPEQQQDAPYSISETNYHIAQLQPAKPNQYGVYFVHPQETLAYQYERNPLDPRMQHGFVLQIDAFGNVLLSCSVTYGRRQGSVDVQPEQLALHITANESSFINQTSDTVYLLGVPLEEKTYEITGLALSPGEQALTFAEITTYLAGLVTASFARLLSWQRYLYWSYPLGQVGPQALLASLEAIVVASDQVEQAFVGVLTPEELNGLLAGEGGYRQDPEKTSWWNPGLSASYLDAAHFFLPHTITDPYGNITTYAYDTSLMLLSSVTDTIGNQVTADFDYQTLSPRQIRDINGNLSEVLFDPLGMVIVTSHHGTENGQAVGFMQLADYKPQPVTSMDDLINNSPQTYLQGAGSYFYYDPLSWSEKQIPVHAVTLVATQYPSPTLTPIQISIGYGDGFGRAQQTSLRVEPGAANHINTDGTISVVTTSQRWLTSGRTVYNNKGNPVKQYEPYYIDTYAYIDTPQLNTFGVSPTLFYDPLARLIRTDTAKGFFSKTEFTAWMEAHYDENDTIKDSSYYQSNINNLAPDFQNARQALQRAALFYNTPATQIHDNLGRTILAIQQQEGIVATNAFVGSGLTETQSQTLWQDLQIGGWLDFRGALTSAFQPDQPGFSLNLSTAFAPKEQQIIAVLKDIQAAGTLLTTHYTWDIQGNQLTSADPRLSAEGKVNFQMLYTLTGSVLKTVSADKGIHWQLQNVMGNAFYARDTRNTEITIAYDALHRPVSGQVKGGDGPLPLNQITERMIYGDSLDAQGQLIVANPDQTNLRGKLYRYYDYAGVTTSPSYSLLGAPLSSSKQLRQDYKLEANWNDISASTLAALLEATIYTESYQYDALGRVTATINNDGNISETTYLLSGRLGQVQVTPQAGAAAEMYVQSIAYNPKGQRESILYGKDGVTATSSYTYEPTTFRLTSIETTRASDAQKLQNLIYTYDPVGNITHLVDGAQEPVFNANQQVKPEADYTYDALYQLIQASGREHPALSPQENEQRGDYDPSWILPTNQPLNNGQALLNYTQQMTYDNAGNLYTIQHQGATAWTRTLTVSDSNNRAVDSTLTTLPANVNAYFDGNGNQKSLSGLPALTWNYLDNIANATVIERQDTPSDAEYYVYDGAGQRVRKVTESYGNGGTSAHIEETIYLGTLEIKRITQGGSVVEERHSLRVMDDQQMVAQRITWIGNPPPGVVNPQVRYQLTNYLGSATMEVDALGQIISYEEYFPYGCTSLIAGRNVSEVELKQYRYSGKERDSATGLYYYGARYYAPWLGRWINPDPAGTVDGLNLYAFVGGNPVTSRDVDGMMRRSERGGRGSGSGAPAPLVDRSGGAPGPSRGGGRGSAPGDLRREFPLGFSEPTKQSIRRMDSIARLFSRDEAVVTAVGRIGDTFYLSVNTEHPNFVGAKRPTIALLHAYYEKQLSPEPMREWDRAMNAARDLIAINKPNHTQFRLARDLIRLGGEDSVSRTFRTALGKYQQGGVQRDDPLHYIQPERPNIHAEITVASYIRDQLASKGGGSIGPIGVNKLNCLACSQVLERHFQTAVTRGTHGHVFPGYTLPYNLKMYRHMIPPVSIVGDVHPILTAEDSDVEDNEILRQVR